MALNEVLASGTNNTVSTFTPSNGLSDCVIDGDPGSKGRILLQAQVPSGNWVLVTDQRGVYSVNTPDTAITYRFRGVNLANSVRVYMGP